MEMHIVEREKLSYIWGKEKQPGEQDHGYEKRYAQNKKVKILELKLKTCYM